jgi:hypothetical protein
LLRSGTFYFALTPKSSVQNPGFLLLVEVGFRRVSAQHTQLLKLISLTIGTRVLVNGLELTQIRQQIAEIIDPPVGPEAVPVV